MFWHSFDASSVWRIVGPLLRAGEHCPCTGNIARLALKLRDQKSKPIWAAPLLSGLPKLNSRVYTWSPSPSFDGNSESGDRQLLGHDRDVLRERGSSNNPEVISPLNILANSTSRPTEN